ncbi:hypothetical protein, partial [Streptomyces ossamyceticus]
MRKTPNARSLAGAQQELERTAQASRGQAAPALLAPDGGPPLQPVGTPGGCVRADRTVSARAGRAACRPAKPIRAGAAVTGEVQWSGNPKPVNSPWGGL